MFLQIDLDEDAMLEDAIFPFNFSEKCFVVLAVFANDPECFDFFYIGLG